MSPLRSLFKWAEFKQPCCRKEKGVGEEQQRPVRNHCCVTFFLCFSLSLHSHPSLLLYVATSISPYAAVYFLLPFFCLSLFPVVRSLGSSGQTKPGPDVITASQTEGGGDSRKEHGKLSAAQPDRPANLRERQEEALKRRARDKKERARA